MPWPWWQGTRMFHIFVPSFSFTCSSYLFPAFNMVFPWSSPDVPWFFLQFPFAFLLFSHHFSTTFPVFSHYFPTIFSLFFSHVFPNVSIFFLFSSHFFQFVLVFHLFSPHFLGPRPGAWPWAQWAPSSRAARRVASPSGACHGEFLGIWSWDEMGKDTGKIVGFYHVILGDFIMENYRRNWKKWDTNRKKYRKNMETLENTCET